MERNKILVCVPVFNEERTIAVTLDSIFKQKHIPNSDLHVLVIASGCTDGTVEIVKNYIENDFAVTLITEPERSGKANALRLINPVIAQLRTDICVFTDGDVELLENSLYEITRPLIGDSSVSATCGHPVIRSGQVRNVWASLAKENCEIWHQSRSSLNRKRQVWPLTGYLYAIRVTELIWNFPNHCAAEDAFIGLSLIQHQKKVLYAAEAKVIVGYPKSLTDYLLQKSRTRVGWRQIKKMDHENYRKLKKVQAQIVFSRFRHGAWMSLTCWLLDIGIAKISDILQNNNTSHELWPPILTSKDLDR